MGDKDNISARLRALEVQQAEEAVKSTYHKEAQEQILAQLKEIRAAVTELQRLEQKRKGGMTVLIFAAALIGAALTWVATSLRIASYLG